MSKTSFIFLIFMSSLVTTNLFSQSIEDYRLKIDSLEQVYNSVQTQLKNIQKEIESYRAAIQKLNFEQIDENHLITSNSREGYLMSEPDPISNVISRVPANTTLKALNFTGRYWKVEYADKVGFISDSFVESNEDQKKYFTNRTDDSLNDIKCILKKIIIDTLYVNEFELDLYSEPTISGFPKRNFEKGQVLYLHSMKDDLYHVLYSPPSEAELANISFNNTDSLKVLLSLFESGWVQESGVQREFVKKLTTAQKRRERYILEHPSIAQQYKVNIRAGKVVLGMSKEMVRASWGDPMDINRTVSSFSVREQWIYGGLQDRQYLYFEDGILTTWQD